MSVETVTQQISSAYRQLRQAHADLLDTCNRYHAEARANYEHQVQQLEVDAPNLRFALADWNDAAWATYAPGADALLSSAVRVGRLEQTQNGHSSDLPALLALIGRNHVLIEGEDPNAARRLLQQILLRVVLAAPPGSVRVNLTDPVGGGSNLGSLLHLPPVLRNDETASHSDEIEKLLDSLVTHIRIVVQTRLLSTYATIEDYNAGQPEMTLPYQFLALPDMPTGFSDRAWERLRFIAENGIAAGVYVIGSSSEEAKAERDQWTETTAGWTTLTVDREDRLEWSDAVFGALAARLDDPPSAVQVNGWCRALERALERAETNISFSRVAIPTARRWRGNSTDELRVPIGVDSKGSVQEFSLGKTNVHALVGGMTRYGKSKLLDVLITQLSLAYSPDEVAFYLVDLKEGVAFQDYMRLPHVGVIALENEREFGLNILRHVQGEIQRRSELFKEVGSGIENLVQYRNTPTGKAMPRILLIIDEFQMLFIDEDSIAREASKILEDIVRRGGAFGIHVVLCSQSPRASGLHHDRIFSQVGLRIAFRCGENVSQTILGENNNAGSELEQPGEAIYNPALGSRARNTRIQVALLDPPERQQLLDEIRAATGEGLPPPITFESKSSAHLQENPELQAALSQPGWQPRRRTARLWLGQPIEIKAPTAAELMRYAGSNLLIAGGDETQAHGLLIASIFSLAAQHSPRELRVIATDFARPESPVEGLFQRVKAAIPHPVEIVRPRQAVSSLDSLLATVTQRLDDESPADTTICFCIAGIQRWRELRPPEFGQTEAGKQLTRLLEEGADVGVHVLAWTDTMASLERAIKRSGLGSFDLRVGLRLSESDSNTVLGTPGAARFEGNRALFRSEDWEAGRVEKFKPYPVPDDATIMALGARLHAKGEV